MWAYLLLFIGFSAVVLLYLLCLPTSTSTTQNIIFSGIAAGAYLVYAIISYRYARKYVSPNTVCILNGLLPISLVSVFVCCVQGYYIPITRYRPANTEVAYFAPIDCNVVRIKEYGKINDCIMRIVLERDSLDSHSDEFIFRAMDGPGYSKASLFITKDAEGRTKAYAVDTPSFISAEVTDMEFELKQPFEMAAWVDAVSTTPGSEIYYIQAEKRGLQINKYKEGQWRNARYCD